MNLTATLHNEPALQASDPVELRSTLLWIVDEMTWIASVRETTAGVSWPSDAQVRIERLRTAAGAWDPAGPLPSDVLDAARHCLGILQPSAEEHRGMDAGDEMRAQMAELASDYHSGAAILERLAAWAYVVANQETVLEHLASFERAYEKFIELVVAGKACAGAADMSAENLERVKRIRRLIQPGLSSAEARQAASEIHALAEQCVEGLKRSEASPAGREAS